MLHRFDRISLRHCLMLVLGGGGRADGESHPVVSAARSADRHAGPVRVSMNEPVIRELLAESRLDLRAHGEDAVFPTAALHEQTRELDAGWATALS